MSSPDVAPDHPRCGASVRSVRPGGWPAGSLVGGHGIPDSQSEPRWECWSVPSGIALGELRGFGGALLDGWLGAERSARVFQLSGEPETKVSKGKIRRGDPLPGPGKVRLQGQQAGFSQKGSSVLPLNTGSVSVPEAHRLCPHSLIQGGLPAEAGHPQWCAGHSGAPPPLSVPHRQGPLLPEKSCVGDAYSPLRNRSRFCWALKFAQLDRCP